MASRPQSVTQILEKLSHDRDPAALDELFSLVYEELRLLAQRQRRRWRGNETMNTTALIHEAYVKLVDQKQIGVSTRAHFFALAARAMRHILSNYARAQRTQKRGDGAAQVPLDALGATLPDSLVLSPERAEVLASLDDALVRLEQYSERQGRVVECRFYGGMSIPETAEALGISPATVKRDWALAQAWLYRELERVSPR